MISDETPAQLMAAATANMLSLLGIVGLTLVTAAGSLGSMFLGFAESADERLWFCTFRRFCCVEQRLDERHQQQDRAKYLEYDPGPGWSDTD